MGQCQSTRAESDPAREDAGRHIVPTPKESCTRLCKDGPPSSSTMIEGTETTVNRPADESTTEHDAFGVAGGRLEEEYCSRSEKNSRIPNKRGESGCATLVSERDAANDAVFRASRTNYTSSRLDSSTSSLPALQKMTQE